MQKELENPNILERSQYRVQQQGQTIKSKLNSVSPVSTYQVQQPQNQNYFEDENEMLRNQIHILEEKLKFIDQEFYIKQASYEKRLQNLSQTCSQLIQQKTSLHLQIQQMLSYSQAQEQQLKKYEDLYTKNDGDKKLLIEKVYKLEKLNEDTNNQLKQAKERELNKKQKFKEQTAQFDILKQQVIQLENECEQQITEKDRIIIQLNQQIDQLKLDYNTALLNFQVKYQEELDKKENDENQVQMIIQETNSLKEDLDSLACQNQDLKVNLEKLHNNYSDLEAEISLFVEWASDYQNNNIPPLSNPLLNQLSFLFKKFMKKVTKLTEKKVKWKAVAQQQQQQITGQSQVIKDSYSEVQMKQIFERRILELENIYQNHKSDSVHKKPSLLNLSDMEYHSFLETIYYKMKVLVQMLSQFFQELYKSSCQLRELNLQLSRLQQQELGFQNFQPQFSKFRACVNMIIAIKRLRFHQTYSSIQLRPLVVESTSLNNFQQLLQIVPVQQEVISRMEDEYNKNRENEIELNRKIQKLQNELEQAKILLKQQVEINKEIRKDVKQKGKELLLDQDNSGSKMIGEIQHLQNEIENYKTLLHANQKELETKNTQIRKLQDILFVRKIQ